MARRRDGRVATSGQLVAYDAVMLDLPVGYVYNWLANREPSGNWISVCIVELSSGVAIDSQTGREIRLEVRDPRAGPVLDRIARDVTLNPMPTPAVFVTPPGPPALVTRGIPIAPPKTGEAGLR